MRIYLRPISIEDSSKIVKWRNSPKVSAHCFDKTQISLESHTQYFKNNIETGKYKQFIVERIDEDFGVSSYSIATVYLKDFDSINRRCEFCIFTSDDEEWNNESQSIAVKMLLDKAFYEYGLNKVYTYVFSTIPDEMELLKRAGFTEEAILKKEAVDSNGNYVDVYRLCVMRDEYVKDL